MIDVSIAVERYRSELDRLHDTYGSWSAIPNDERRLVSEHLRAAYCLAAGTGSTEDILSYYAIDPRVAAEILGRDIQPRARKRRLDPRQVIVPWCVDHAGETVSVETIAEAAECSYATALTITKDRPDLFTRLKKGSYLVRNPHERNAPQPKEEIL